MPISFNNASYIMQLLSQMFFADLVKKFDIIFNKLAPNIIKIFIVIKKIFIAY